MNDRNNNFEDRFVNVFFNNADITIDNEPTVSFDQL